MMIEIFTPLEKGRKYSIEELKIICHERHQWDILKRLQEAPPPDSFVSDGCSMWPDEWSGVVYFEDCWWHDLDYWLGGSQLQKFLADLGLAEKIATRFDREGKTDDGITMAWAMLTGVHLGGNIGPWQWGFGRK